ncbi:hypothetical protein M9979_06745 [Sphingomonas sp. RP10(2022)]|uniref:Uncharacterized protein n=1 Tax=Sphingomonas liriopis TaxID=2949094 RepID=A0A9X2HUH9_9SPHN|nr:hypothetical protein [Sphingomonas liriopis]MCP3734571.1 hypothetical protein [Sphingomonas liriopis]
MSLPPDYARVLDHLGRAFTAYKAATTSDPVLVGGAATAIGTGGLFMSTDFDVIAADDQAFARAMTDAGFVQDGGIGHLANAYYLADCADYVVEQVSGALFDGRSDRERLVRLTVKSGGEIVMPSIEDLIADRLGQHAVASRSDQSRLLQAKALFDTSEAIDLSYLIRRIAEEGGDPALLGL